MEKNEQFEVMYKPFSREKNDCDNRLIYFAAQMYGPLNFGTTQIV